MWKFNNKNSKLAKANTSSLHSKRRLKCKDEILIFTNFTTLVLNFHNDCDSGYSIFKQIASVS